MDATIPEPRLLDRLRNKIRLKGYSQSTEKIYCYWVRQYILYHGKRHPDSMGPHEIEAFLSHLAVDRNVSASTQNQALSALLFLHKLVLGQQIDAPIKALRAKKYDHIPSVLTVEETRNLLNAMSGTLRLAAPPSSQSQPFERTSAVRRQRRPGRQHVVGFVSCPCRGRVVTGGTSGAG